tara:strand:+ start:613 stop:912 length:300 start_codon:yes stop_codon:yes gene_type:complete
MKVTSFIYQLLFDRNPKKSNTNTQELFHTDSYLRPNHENYRECPKCSVNATTNKEIIDLFGTVNVNNNLKFQSWCRKCRNNDKDNNKNDKIDMQNKIEL